MNFWNIGWNDNKTSTLIAGCRAGLRPSRRDGTRKRDWPRRRLMQAALPAAQWLSTLLLLVLLRLILLIPPTITTIHNSIIIINNNNNNDNDICINTILLTPRRPTVRSSMDHGSDRYMSGKRDSIHHHLLEAISETANVLELKQKLLYTIPFGWWWWWCIKSFLRYMSQKVVARAATAGAWHRRCGSQRPDRKPYRMAMISALVIV